MHNNNYTRYNAKLKNRAQNLRKDMTKQEGMLWHLFLKKLYPKFYRQRSIGIYIADFYCSKAKLVIEIDGGQHYSQEGMDYDEQRTMFLNSIGLEVIRFNNLEVEKNFNGVCYAINEKIKERT
ncbi:MAG: DUF559 domain-containing protein [Phascolarctobacterium sp.]|nr:DUF559 domain-containing protein [Phascolarctobacterium sp.]